MSNATTDPASTMVFSQHVLTILIMLLICLVGIPGNFLVLWITSMKVERTAMTIWFWNLALADMACCLLFPFFVAQLFHEGWLYGLALCKMLPSLFICTMFASIFTLVAISVDRCVLVAQPVWAKNHRTLRMAWMTCLAIWMLSILMCLLDVIHRTTLTVDNLTQCAYGEMEIVYGNGSDVNEEIYVKFPDKAVTYTRMIFGFLIPFLIISVSYGILASKVKHTRFGKVGGKTTKVVFVVVIAFFVCWAPYHLMGIILLYCHQDNFALAILDFLSLALAYSNSCINPILYVFLGKVMKSKVQRSFRQLMESVFTQEQTKSSDHSRSKVTTDESMQLEGQKD